MMTEICREFKRIDFGKLVDFLLPTFESILAKSVLPDRIIFNPFGVRFGVRFQLQVHAIGGRLVALCNHFFPSSVVW